MKSNYLFLIISVILITSCSPPQYFLSSEYDKDSITDQRICISLVPSVPSIANKDDVTDDLGLGDENSVYISFLKKNLVNSFLRKTFMKEVGYVDDFPSGLLKEKKVRLNEEENISIRFPEEKTIFDLDSTHYNYIILLQNLKVERHTGQSGVWIAGMYSGGSSPTLGHISEFLIWDNDKGQVVSYGKVNTETSFLFAMTKDTWLSSMNDIANYIIKNSPFKYKSARQ